MNPVGAPRFDSAAGHEVTKMTELNEVAMELGEVSIGDVRPCDAFEGDTPRATLEFETQALGPDGVRTETRTAEVFIKDVAWALHCIVDQGALTKIHAGCFFFDDEEGGVRVGTGDGGFTLTYEEAGRVVDEFRPEVER